MADPRQLEANFEALKAALDAARTRRIILEQALAAQKAATDAGAMLVINMTPTSDPLVYKMGDGTLATLSGTDETAIALERLVRAARVLEAAAAQACWGANR
jgi:hypothetical protein